MPGTHLARLAHAQNRLARSLVVGDGGEVARTITVVSDNHSDLVRSPSVVVANPRVSRNAVYLEERVANVSARRPSRQVGYSAVLTVLRERSRCCFTDSLASAG